MIWRVERLPQLEVVQGRGTVAALHRLDLDITQARGDMRDHFYPSDRSLPAMKTHPQIVAVSFRSFFMKPCTDSDRTRL